MKRIYLSLVFLVFTVPVLFAQGDNGEIRITLIDKTTNEAIPFANVVAYKDGVQVGVSTTNMDGEAVIKPLPPGKYTVKGTYIGYQTTEVKDILVGEGKTAYVKVPLAGGDVNLDEVIVIAYEKPLIDPDVKSGHTITQKEWNNMATKDINSAAATSAGVYQSDENRDLNVRGGRNTQMTYFVDGVKVIGKPNLSQQSIEQLSIITGGVPANYGDLTAGAYVISTRGPQAKTFGGIELISSQLTDAFGYNSLAFSVGGPIYKKRDTTRRIVLGYFIAGQGVYQKEPNPSFVPIYVLKDEKLQEIKSQPLTVSPSGTGFIRTSEFVTKADMETQKFRPNSSFRSISLNAKLDFAPSANTYLSLGGYYEYRDALGPNQANNLFNYENNALTSTQNYRTNLSLTQKFGKHGVDKEKTQSLISNAFFKFQVSYENRTLKTESAKHKDDIFSYGHIGKFDRTFLDREYAYNYQFTPDYVYNGETINAYTFTGRREQPVTFSPGTANPDAALYTSYVMEHAQTNNISMNYIVANNGLRNGDRPQSIYSLYNNFGTYQAVRSVQNDNTFRVVSSFNADVKKHAVTFGMEFDQRILTFYSLNGAGLWIRMRQLSEDPIHIQSLDRNNPILVPELSGTIPFFYYDRIYQPELKTQFYEQLLEKKGLPQDYTGFINIDAMDPSEFSIDMFSAEDMLGNTSESSVVSYIGYSHQGKRDKRNVSIDDFLNEKDNNGRNLFPIGTFKPIYASVYVMDKFDFRDIKFNAGLRIDRFDANQPVLKTNYAFHELAKVSDLTSMENLPAGFADNLPANISPDAAVYVAQNPGGGKSPLAINGFRDGDRWYNAEGSEVSDPKDIQSSDGRPVPLFKDFANYDKPMSSGGFTDYVAAINPMPRIAFSFPISDVASFFAHYDILTQRPQTNVSWLNPLEYYFMTSGGASPLIANPNLRPQQKIDYELGFSQVLNERKNAVLTITSFYNETRNLINVRMVAGAYPRNFLMFDNIDFATVKGLSFKFELRRTRGSEINFNYTLQFAEGSGSNVNSGANLASSGQPNLRVLVPLDFDQRHTFVLNYDYRFGVKKDYLGPKYKSKKTEKDVHILEGVGFNVTFILGSGTPYTRWNAAVPINGGGAGNIVGQINGSNKPWNFRSNLRLDKEIELTWNKDNPDKKKVTTLQIYLQVLNVFNIRNVLGVYNYTGLPDDDGYLSSTQAQAALLQTNSSAAFIDMYSIRVNNPGNYSLPRQTRIGLLFSF